MLDLEAIELIKQLKARYFRFLDTGNQEGLESVFTEDATAHFIGGHYDIDVQGRDKLLKFYAYSFTEEKFGMHNGHHPEISVDGDNATGLWYLQDIFINLEENTTVMGSAIYEDTYVKVDGEWKIKTTNYERLWEEIHPRSADIKLLARPVKTKK
ncbi:hypothetical protein IMCC3088_2632 [Aequoribacter fuscus]|jgi:hypothetical protein|uniref:SnoaL-like domain-containing protein n=1 Tax=Aequoribacter fuscus TaxID=2518989 RepID=F3L4N1_9GAMM|nr:nuclear transport factor 2 family protein [Aequoribacter fuscus]EGG28679.1 hypothetical protein IMCC3088_2632 [Aequoribacter fuscus]QHJ89135.1 nuclear transport factor 2 family protein [Aequoribacter fuscus]